MLSKFVILNNQTFLSILEIGTKISSSQVELNSWTSETIQRNPIFLLFIDGTCHGGSFFVSRDTSDVTIKLQTPVSPAFTIPEIGENCTTFVLTSDIFHENSNGYLPLFSI
jgi:hypothetical protein